MKENGVPSVPPIRTHLAQMEREKQKAAQLNKLKLAEGYGFYSKEKAPQLFSDARSSSSSLTSTSSASSVNSSTSLNGVLNCNVEAMTADTINGGAKATPVQDVHPEGHNKTLQQANEIKDKGNSYVKSGDFDMAIKTYSMAIKLHSKDPVFYTNRALCYLKLER